MPPVLTTPTRGDQENHQGVLTDASARFNRQPTNSFGKKPKYQYLSRDSLTTPDCKEFNLDYYFSGSSKSSHPSGRRLRGSTSTRILRDFAPYQQAGANHNSYNTSPYTPSKLSKVMIAEYELPITDIDTPPPTMPTRLSLNKKLPSKPIFRLENSPERRGLLDATDLNSSSLQFPILLPKSPVKEPTVAEPVSTKSLAQDLHSVVTRPISHICDTGSNFEIGIAQIGTAYEATTISKISPPPNDEKMTLPTVRQNNSSLKRMQHSKSKLTGAVDSTQTNSFNLTVPNSNDRLTPESHLASLQSNGSPVPKKERRARSSLGNGECRAPTNNTFSRYPVQKNRLSTESEIGKAPIEPLIQVDDDNVKLRNPTEDATDGIKPADSHEDSKDSAEVVAEDATQDVTQDSNDGQTRLADQEVPTEDVVQDVADIADKLTRVATNNAILAVTQSGSMGRSESQTTIGRRNKMVPPPSKRFARDADRTILGRSPPYSKVGARTYMEQPIEEVEDSNASRRNMTSGVPTTKPKGLKRVLAARAGSSTTQSGNIAVSDDTNGAKSNFARRQSSLPDSPENKTLKPVTVEKRLSFTERLTKPTASSAARANARKSVPAQKSNTMASVKNAGRGLKSRLSGMIRTRRASEVVGLVDPAVHPSFNVTEQTTVQHDIPTVVLERPPEIAPFANDRDVGEEFASFYSKMESHSEQFDQAGLPTCFIEPVKSRVIRTAEDTIETANETNKTYQQILDHSTLVTQSPIISVKRSAMSDAEVDAIFETRNVTTSDSVIRDRIQKLSLANIPTRTPPSVPADHSQFQADDGNDVQVAGDNALDPPPNEQDNRGHTDKQPQPQTFNDSLDEIKDTLAKLRAALQEEQDPYQQLVLIGFSVHLTSLVQSINNNRKLLVFLKRANDAMWVNASVESLEARKTLHYLARRVVADSNI
ncbi:40b6a75a-6310-4661-9e7f-bf2f043c6496 [Sclerotinia trifoliorum]|uniref:40b6a75a-6310-4661-9e7f-bf2f043c6496 n=1 Tax=Sclerotinia trifoliorum TaxID=28548 RepID=A0A8H2VP02_9HELO|nr:40b6a75a-6310-4661-9e7f-bf2f043c6496 [Sclerotinia trifoliorum]